MSGRGATVRLFSALALWGASGVLQAASPVAWRAVTLLLGFVVICAVIAAIAAAGKERP